MRKGYFFIENFQLSRKYTIYGKIPLLFNTIAAALPEPTVRLPSCCYGAFVYIASRDIQLLIKLPHIFIFLSKNNFHQFHNKNIIVP